MAQRRRRGDAHAVEIGDVDSLVVERRRVAERRAGERRVVAQLLQLPCGEQRERNRIAATPRPFVFAMVVVGERVAREALDPFGSKLAGEAIGDDLVVPALSALAIFTFLGNWTAFLWPLIAITDRNLYKLPVGIASFSGEFQTEWEMVMTGASVATIPTIVVFLLLQRYIVRGIALAGLKA